MKNVQKYAACVCILACSWLVLNWEAKTEEAWKCQLLEYSYKLPHTLINPQTQSRAKPTDHDVSHPAPMQWGFLCKVTLLQPRKAACLMSEKPQWEPAGLCSSIWPRLRCLPGWTLYENNWPGQQCVRWTNEYLLLGDLMAKIKGSNASLGVIKHFSNRLVELTHTEHL